MNLINIFLVSMFAENVILSKFLGICSFLGTSNKEKNATMMGISVTFVVMCSTIITYLINTFILIPSDSTYLSTITFILVIACFVQITELIIKRFFNNIYKELGIYLPLITTNCAVFGIILTNINNNYDLITSLVCSLGSSLGFFVVLYLFSTIRENLDNSSINVNFKGIPIALITAGIMSLIFGRLI